MQNGPLLFGGSRWLVEQRRRNFEFADVVEQRRPTQSSPIPLGKSQFPGEQVGEDPDALRMSTACSIVNAQREHELDDG